MKNLLVALGLLGGLVLAFLFASEGQRDRPVPRIADIDIYTARARDDICQSAFTGTPADQARTTSGNWSAEERDCWQACRRDPDNFICKHARVEGGRLKMRSGAAVDRIVDPVRRRSDAIKNLDLLGYKYHGNDIEFAVRNNSDYDIKDVQFSCDFIAPSGTVLRTVRLTAYDKVSAHTPYQPVWAAHRYSDRGSASSRCSISYATVMD